MRRAAWGDGSTSTGGSGVMPLAVREGIYAVNCSILRSIRAGANGFEMKCLLAGSCDAAAFRAPDVTKRPAAGKRSRM